jgi:8-oxo-dGTP pyrophosphatase MutT (NUDIX family)
MSLGITWRWSCRDRGRHRAGDGEAKGMAGQWQEQMERLRALIGQRAPADPGTLRRPAAVLVLLAPVGGEASVLLTVRPGHLSRHPGQVACPGGGYEPTDGSLWETALREAREEVGLNAGDVAVVGQLSPVFIGVSGFTLVPWVGAADRRPALEPAPAEVERVFWVPLARLAAVRRQTMYARGGDGVPRWYPEFPLPEATVWGATALVLDELLTVWPSEGVRRDGLDGDR